MRSRRARPNIGDMPESAAVNCPAAPPANASVYARTLHRACLVLGGAERLAAHLQVAPETLLAWLQGEEPPTEQAFLSCVEIVLLQAESPGPAN